MIVKVKLTSKQELFVQSLIKGKTQRQAYIDAGYSVVNRSESDIDSLASKLAKSYKVSTRLTELRAEIKERALWTREEAINDLIWLKEQSKSTIASHGEVKHAPATAFLGAVTELNKLGIVYDLEVEKLKLSIEKQKKELSNDQSTEDKLSGLMDRIDVMLDVE